MESSDILLSTDENSNISEEAADETTGNRDNQKVEMPSVESRKGSTSSDSKIGSGKYVLSDGEILTGGIYTSEDSDVSAIRADSGITATLNGVTVEKSDGDASSADNSSFYSLNAAVQCIDGATLTINESTITASAKNATGVFAYNGGTIYIEDSIVNVTGGGSGGIQVAGGGILYATNLTVTSDSKAAIRSDRGGGILAVDGGIYTSNGSSGCPAVYSTADITVKNATLISNNSRAVIVEGKNSVTIENCDVTGCDQSTKSGSVLGNVMLYQSASGDASVGTSCFSMEGGCLTSQAGTMFYCTNTSSIITLNGVTLNNSATNGLLTVSSGRWGSEGRNGGNCTFIADNQSLSGDIIVDTISTLDMTLKNKSVFTGTINIVENTDGGNVVSNNAVITIESGCTWNLTSDCTITSLENSGTINFNGYTITLADGTVLK